MNITHVGADLAKSVFSVCAMGPEGRVVERRDLKRDSVLAWLQRLPQGCIVGMEACGAAHHWARQLSLLGLVPRQFSSGGKARLGGITRRGDAYVRTLLVQGAKSSLKQALKASPENATRLQRWACQLHGRAGYHKTLVAIANKNARVLWALLARDEHYNPDAWKDYAKG